VVEHLPCIFKALVSIPDTKKKKKKQEASEPGIHTEDVQDWDVSTSEKESDYLFSSKSLEMNCIWKKYKQMKEENKGQAKFS
jgi:hypothetical protein